MKTEAKASSIVDVMAQAMFSNETAARCTIECLVAAGYAVVPLHPTEEMVEAAFSELRHDPLTQHPKYMWQAMASARPQ